MLYNLSSPPITFIQVSVETIRPLTKWSSLLKTIYVLYGWTFLFYIFALHLTDTDTLFFHQGLSPNRNIFAWLIKKCLPSKHFFLNDIWRWWWNKLLFVPGKSQDSLDFGPSLRVDTLNQLFIVLSYCLLNHWNLKRAKANLVCFAIQK